MICLISTTSKKRAASFIGAENHICLTVQKGRTMSSRSNDKLWLNKFAFFLSTSLKELNISISSWAAEHNVTDSTVRCWTSGRNLPSEDLLGQLCQTISDEKVDIEKRYQLYDIAVEIFADTTFVNRPQNLRGCLPQAQFTSQVLRDLWLLTKGKDIEWEAIPPTGTTQAVVFDFDGTLVHEDNRTTWEQLWVLLGYRERDCQELHQRFNNGEITHKKWCEITSERFREKGLNRKQVESLGKTMRPLDGVNETFKELSSNGIKIYIVSGSIYNIIQEALDGALQYVDEIKCNRFDYDKDGKLKRIVGTRYDFLGKAEFIRMKAAELEISCRDILFVGNSINDRFAYRSGARTLCINPRLVDITDTKAWNNVIQSCSDLTEMLQYLDYAV